MTGLWCNLFVDARGNEMLGILHISEDDGEIKYGGENYDQNGDFQGAFSSSFIGEDWPHVLFRYRTVQSAELDLTEGIIELRFHVDGSRLSPDSFVGSFFDFGKKITFVMEGFRIKDDALTQKLQDPKVKKAAIRDLKALLRSA